MINFLKNNRGKILQVFFNNPGKEYYLREIAQILKKEAGNYQRYLNELVTSGILTDERRGNMRFFRLNKDYPLYQELKSMVSKTVGLEQSLKVLVGRLTVTHAFVFGSIAAGQESGASDIDLLLVGDVDQDLLIGEIGRLERELGREINYHVYSRDEVVSKIKGRDSFFLNVFRSPLITLKGDAHEFIRLAKQ